MPHNLAAEGAEGGDCAQGGHRGHVRAGGGSPLTVGPLREVTDGLTPGQGVARASPGPHLRGDGSHCQVGGRLEVVLGGDVDMVGAHSLHHRPRARPHQPGHIGGALVGLGLEGVPLLTGSEDVATRGNVLITDR